MKDIIAVIEAEAGKEAFTDTPAFADGEFWDDPDSNFAEGVTTGYIMFARELLERIEANKKDNTPPTESYDDLFNALHRISSAACAMPTFEVRHEGGLDAFVQNIIDAIAATYDKPN